MASEGSTTVMDSHGAGGLTRPKSQDFAEQIRQLEVEGSRLLEATNTLSCSVLTSPNYDKAGASKTSASSLSALTDISAEQKTIDDLRVQLDAQSRETERLQQSLAEPSLGLGRYPLVSRSSSLSALNLPSVSSPGSVAGPPSVGAYGGLVDLGASGHSLGGSSSHALGVSGSSAYSARLGRDYSSQTHTDRQLKEMQEEINGLRNRLRQALSLGEEQKHSYRNTQEELKRQMSNALASKDNVIDAKTRELSAHESMVSRLQGAVDRLEQNNRLQEQTMLELNHKLDVAQKDQYVLENVTSQLRKMASERERLRGCPFSDTENLAAQSPSVLLHYVERYSAELEAQNEENALRLKQVNAELETLRATSIERQHSISRHHQDRLAELAETHDSELSSAVERAIESRKQVTSLQEELATLRQDYQQLGIKRDDEISQLKRELESAHQTHSRGRSEWLEKKQALEAAIDATQKEASSLKHDQNDAIYQRAKLEAKVEELQQTVSQLEEELRDHRSAEEQLSRRNQEVEEELSRSAHTLDQREQEVQHLQALVEAAKQESNAQLKTAVETLEREEKSKSAQQLRALSERLTDSTERLQQLTLQHELLKAEHRALEERHRVAEAAREEAVQRADTAFTAKENLTGSLQDTVADIGRLSQEKDYYLKLADERGKEAGELRVEVDKLAVQLEERQKNFTLLKEQNDKINQLFASNSEATRSLREERDRLADQLNTRVSDAEQRKTTHEHLSKKLRIREKHLQDLQEDNQKMAELLATNKTDLEQITREKESIFEELKDSRYEVADLKEKTADLEKKLEEREKDLKKELDRVRSKLKVIEQDYKMTKKALKTKEHVDGKAVRVAGKMQREVTEKRGHIDSLQSKVRWLEECLENTVKEKKVLQDETERLTASLKKLVVQNERLTADVTATATREKDSRDRMARLEAALEKAAVKHAAAQAQIEQFEQDIARLKLKHQLELKELVRVWKTSGKSQTSNVLEAAKAVANAPKPEPPAIPPPAPVVVPAPVTLPAPTMQAAPVHGTQSTNGVQSGVGGELRELLEEMRSLIKSGKETQQQQQQWQHQPHSQHRENHADHYHPHPQFTQSQPLTSHPVVSSKCDTCRDGSVVLSDRLGFSDGPYTGHTSRTMPLVDIQPTKLKAKVQTNRWAPRSVTVPEPAVGSYSAPSPSTSPVSDLLGDTLYKDIQDTVSSITGITDDLDDSPALKGQNFKLPADTNLLCKRLEKKIKKLSKLGNHLQEENKEIGEMMRNQDAQLKKVKHSGKLLKA